MAYKALSTVEHDGVVVLKHGEKVTAKLEKELGDDVLNTLHETGVLIDEALWPKNFDDRPEGQTSTVGFRVPSLSEHLAAVAKEESERAERGEVQEISK